MVRNQTLLSTLLACGLALAAAPIYAQDDNSEERLRPVTATGQFVPCTAGAPISGRAVLVEHPSREGVKQVEVSLSIGGLPPGKHAVHIHAVGACAPTCGAAGGHFDPGPNSNPSPDGNHPFHMGDLINLQVGRSGVGTLHTVTSRVTLSPGPLSLFDADGSAFIVHVAEDTYCPSGEAAGCAGGARAACAVIEKVQ